MSKNVNFWITLNSKIWKKFKSQFTISADLGSILVPKNNEKQNLGESYTNKYQKNVAYSFAYKVVYAGDNSSKPLSFT